MKQFFFGLVAFGLVLPAHATSVAVAQAMAISSTDATAATSDPSPCLDSMETVPDDDDLVPTPASVDGGCSVSADTIST